VLTAPVVAPRAAGQILCSAWARLRDERKRFVPVAAFVFAGAVAAAGLQWLLVRSSLQTTVDVVGRDTPLGQLLAVVAGLAITVPVAIVGLAWSVDLADRDAGSDGAVGAARSRASVWRSGLLVPCAILVLTVLLGWIVLPLGAYVLARWFVAPAAAAGDGPDTRDALRISSMLTRGRRTHTMLIAAVTVAVAFFLGLLLGVFALILTDASFTFVNVAAGLIGAVLLPWMGIVLAMTYGDLRARHEDPALGHGGRESTPSARRRHMSTTKEAL
jgi:hypothetical protein